MKNTGSIAIRCFYAYGKQPVARNAAQEKIFVFLIAFLCCMYYNQKRIGIKNRGDSGRNDVERMRYADVPTSKK